MLRPLSCAAVLIALLGCGDGGDGSNGGGSAAGGSNGAQGGGTASSGGGSGSTGGGSGSTGGGSGSTGGGSASNGGGGSSSTGGGTSSSGGGTATSSGVTIIVEPSDNAAALKAAINGAKTSLHMTMYLLSNTGIIDALLARKTAGLDVKVVLNKTFPTGDTSSNQDVYTQLSNAGIGVAWAPSTFTLTHEKCVIIDNSTAWIMTMNATQTSPTENREYLAVDTLAADVAQAETIFEHDFANTSYSPPATGLLVAPVSARPQLLTAIAATTKTLDCEGEELSDSDIVSAMISAKNRGVVVHFVLSDATGTASQTTALAQLKNAGITVVVLHTPYVHAKSMVFDGTTAYVGSENFTTASLLYNRELGLIVTVPSEVQKVLTTTATDYANGTAL